MGACIDKGALLAAIPRVTTALVCIRLIAPTEAPMYDPIPLKNPLSDVSLDESIHPSPSPSSSSTSIYPLDNMYVSEPQVMRDLVLNQIGFIPYLIGLQKIVE